jgi:methylmalonyl-CoA mutase
LQEESEICNTVDPLAGSYYVEALTDTIVQEARKIIKKIDEAGGMARAIELDIPKRMIEEAAAETQSLIDQGKRVIVGVNKYTLQKEEAVNVFEIDNKAVREEQIDSLHNIKSTRNSVKVEEALAKIRVDAKEGGNLLAAAIDAARVRATLGEISDAMEDVFGRYLVPSQCVTGVISREYHNSEEGAREFDEVKQLVDDYANNEGRRPRILIAKMGQDGHDRGAKVIASAYSDFGFDVDLSPMFSTPEEIAKLAVENDVHFVGASSLAAGHKTLVPELIKKLQAYGRGDIKVIVGGVIPPQDYDYLLERGVARIYGPGTQMIKCVREAMEMLNQE